MFDVFYLDQPTGLFPHERPASSISDAQRQSRTRFCWVITYLADYTGWDWLWEPPPWESQYRHAWPSQWQPDAGTYLVPQHQDSGTKYHTAPVIPRRPDHRHWHIPPWIRADAWDMSWHPDPRDPPLIYHFDTQRGWDHVGGPEYRVPGADQRRYLSEPRALTQGDPGAWHIPSHIDPASIDASWCPNPCDPPYIYEFPVEWGWDHVGGPEYHVPGATQRKYVQDFVARTLPDPGALEIRDDLAQDDPIRRWRPDPSAPPYIYVFGNQWYAAEIRASAVYTVPGAQHTHYVQQPRAQRLPCDQHWQALVPGSTMDLSWEPDPGSPPYIYVFGNQWYDAEIMPTWEYHQPGARDRRYMDQPRAQLQDTQCEAWHALVDCEWDRTWRPDPGSPPYIYVFGNQWHAAEIMPTVEYHQPGARDRRYMDHPRATLPQRPGAWTVPPDMDASTIDFSWCPDPGSPPYIYHFGTEYHNTSGVIYHQQGAQDIKFAGDIPRLGPRPVMIPSDVFYLDFSNALSAQRFRDLQARIPQAQRVRWVNDHLSTLRRCADRAKTPQFWVVSSHNDYSDFDFGWHPPLWQRGHIHVFGTQWNAWSDTFLIDRSEFLRQVAWQSDLRDFYNLNFVGGQQVLAAADAIDIVLVDHGNAQRHQVQADLQARPGRVVRSARYFDNYLDTLRRIITDDITASHVWVCSTLCDYSDFDFSWQPEAWQRDMIHVFASGLNKFGDTFLVPVAAWRDQQARLELLEWFDTVNYVPDISVPRWPMPVIQHHEDTQVNAVLDTEFSAPLMLFTVAHQPPRDLPTVSIWRDRTETVVPLDPGAASVIVPRRAVPSIRTQLYDYAHIDRTHRHSGSCDPLDIVFVSNGEPDADRHWHWLCETLGDHHNSVRRVDGITGRVAAYQAAAQASTTPWFFAVFAKLEVSADFDWAWQPDRMQQPKHYIFHALNPVNGLVYGHQAMIAYNRALVMSNPGQGLDFTLDQPHEVVPRMSGTAWYANSAWMAWRTAFREAIKLRHSLPDVENEYRLDQWLQPGQGINAQWSQWGAEDAVAYYDEVSGDFAALRQSYEWAWLASYARQRRNLTPSQ